MAKSDIEDMIDEQTDSRAFVAVPEEQKPRAAFTVRKLDGTYQKTRHYFDKEKNKILSKVVDVSRGYLVTCLKGHSVHAIDEDHLRQIRANMKMIPIVNADGEQVSAIPNKIAA